MSFEQWPPRRRSASATCSRTVMARQVLRLWPVGTIHTNICLFCTASLQAVFGFVCRGMGRWAYGLLAGVPVIRLAYRVLAIVNVIAPDYYLLCMGRFPWLTRFCYSTW